MSTIEPTEEQRMAAARYYANGRELTPYTAAWVKTGEGCDGDNVDTLARLLAEREAAYLAHIKALRGDGAALLNCEHNNMREMRDQFVSTLIATAHYDVEGGEG